jgi:DNA-directed RNA polymerase subunit RPC12/RpoP
MSNKFMTPAERYVATGGTRCPYCKSAAVFGDEDFVTDENLPGIVTNRIECDDCGRVWRDIYKLVALRGIEEA